jgi:hypothetical protein
METMQYYRAMEAVYRQRAKMNGDDCQFWLAKADVLAKLATNAQRRQALEKEKRPQGVAP